MFSNFPLALWIHRLTIFTFQLAIIQYRYLHSLNAGGDHWKQMYINYYYYPRCIRKRELSTFGAKRNHGTLGLALMHFPLSNLAFGPDALESDYTPYSPHLLGLRLHHDSLQHGLLSSSPFSRQVSSSARLAQQTRLTLGDECWTYDLLLSPNTPIFVIIKFVRCIQRLLRSNWRLNYFIHLSIYFIILHKCKSNFIIMNLTYRDAYPSKI